MFRPLTSFYAVAILISLAVFKAQLRPFKKGFRLSSSEIYLTVPKMLQNSFILYVLAMNDFNHMLGEEKGKSKSGATKKGEMLKKILFFFKHNFSVR